jgi:hypothetical protein
MGQARIAFPGTKGRSSYRPHRQTSLKTRKREANGTPKNLKRNNYTKAVSDHSVGHAEAHHRHPLEARHGLRLLTRTSEGPDTLCGLCRTGMGAHGILVHVADFHHKMGPGLQEWRVKNISSPYPTAGVRPFAFLALSRNSTGLLKEGSFSRGVVPVHCSV